MAPTGKKENGSLLMPKAGDKDAYFIRLPVFEGPFELLYYLIKKEEINIWDISLAQITEEYLNYLRTMQKLSMDPAGNFLVMAANLLYLKSKMLLPKQPPQEVIQSEEDAFFFGSKEELVRHLLEYSYFKTIALKLKQREAEQKKIFLRSPDQPKVVIVHKQSSLYPYSFEVLVKTFQKLQQKGKAKREEKAFFTFTEETTLLDKINAVLKSIRKIAAKKFYMEKLLEREGKREMILTFFALLELTRRGKIYLNQKTLFGKIQISVPARRSGEHQSEA
ncbi:MAG: segregation/condensation protein A [Firmicutes bacterium]|nr:segregation/condensation protein A [Bacillota bacterium]